MPLWKWLHETLAQIAKAGDAAVSDMVMPNVTPDQILSAALGFDTKSVGEIAKDRDQYADFWLSLEVARRQLEQQHVLKLVHLALRARVAALQRENLNHHAVPLQRVADALGELLNPSCEHSWEVLTRRIGGTQIHGCRCTKCGAIRPQSAEAGSII